MLRIANAPGNVSVAGPIQAIHTISAALLPWDCCTGGTSFDVACFCCCRRTQRKASQTRRPVMRAQRPPQSRSHLPRPLTPSLLHNGFAENGPMEQVTSLLSLQGTSYV